jgi:hypothetical protein
LGSSTPDYYPYFSGDVSVLFSLSPIDRPDASHARDLTSGDEQFPFFTAQILATPKSSKRPFPIGGDSGVCQVAF